MEWLESLVLPHLPLQVLPGLWLYSWWEWHRGGDGWFVVKSAYWVCSWRWPKWLGG